MKNPLWLRLFVSLCTIGTVTTLASTVAWGDTVDYTWVTVRDAGNAADTNVSPSYGSVGYDYKIGKYEVTASQWVSFLNAVDPTGTNPYGLYDIFMTYDTTVASVSFTSGATSGSKYAVIGNNGNKPIVHVTWFDAARFANWMNNGQGNASTETGAYTLVGGQTSGVAPARNEGATIYIPTENEWYKAAYFSPTRNGPGSPGYWSFATQSDSDPGNVVGGAANQANLKVNGVYSVTQSSSYQSVNYLSDVGAFTGSASYYGTFDQTGNVSEYMDTDGSAGTTRVVRGGDWSNDPWRARSLYRYVSDTNNWGNSLGFRLASVIPVPEIDPAGSASVMALVTGVIAMLERRRIGSDGSRRS